MRPSSARNQSQGKNTNSNLIKKKQAADRHEENWRQAVVSPDASSHNDHIKKKQKQNN